MKSENTSIVLKELVARLKIRLTATSITAELNKHPEHYSFLGMSDVLRTFRVPNGVFELPHDQLSDLETPFIAHLSSNSGEFVLVTKQDSNELVLFNETYDHQKIKRDWFNLHYTGRVLVAEAADDAGERDHALKIRRELRERYRGSLLLIGAALLLICLMGAELRLYTIHPQLFFSLLLKLAGSVLSVLLALKSIDVSNPLLNRLCFNGPRSDCNQVIYSRHAKITDELSWAEAGLLYFCSTFLVLLVGASYPDLSAYVALLSIPASVYIIYSLYLQAWVIKQWCILCLGTLGVLLADAILLFPYIAWPVPALSAGDVFCLMGCLLLPVIVWAALKPKLKAARVLVTARRQLRDIKGRNIHLFRRLMAEQPVLQLPPAGVTIMEGELASPTLITIISKPHCEACGEAHRELSSWLQVRGDIQVQLIFYVLNYDGDAETEVATYLMRLYRQLGPEAIREAIDSWFGSQTKDIKEWAAKYPLDEDTDVSADLKLQQQWCLANDISSTPKVLINGRELPGFYKPEEIKYFI